MASKISIIIQREYRTRIMKKSFIIMTLLGPLFFLIISFLPALLITLGEQDKQLVAVIDHTGLYSDVLKSNELYAFHPATQPLEHYQKEGEQSTYSAVLEIRQDLREDPKAITLFSFTTLPKGIEDYINSTLSKHITEQKLTSYNIDGLEEIIRSSETKIYVSTYKVGTDGEKTLTSGALSQILGVMLAMMSYMFISIYGGGVMQSVMEEKKSRIMEVIVSSVKPFQLMLGKVIGVGAVGLTQIAIWVVLITTLSLVGQFVFADFFTSLNAVEGGAVGAQSIAGFDAELASFVASLSGVNYVELALCFVLYFVGGFLLYASIFAALGSAVSSDEDVQSITWPITVIMMASFYVGFSCLNSPEGTLAQVASYIPFTSPMVMMIRIPYGVELWEQILSLMVLYLSFALFMYLGAKVYRIGVLMYGKKPSLREILRWIKD